jgi:hypothetical protein
MAFCPVPAAIPAAEISFKLPMHLELITGLLATWSGLFQTRSGTVRLQNSRHAHPRCSDIGGSEV